MKKILSIILGSILLTGCASSDLFSVSHRDGYLTSNAIPSENDINYFDYVLKHYNFIGMTKAEVIKILGEPKVIEEIYLESYPMQYGGCYFKYYLGEIKDIKKEILLIAFDRTNVVNNIELKLADAYKLLFDNTENILESDINKYYLGGETINLKTRNLFDVYPRITGMELLLDLTYTCTGTKNNNKEELYFTFEFAMPYKNARVSFLY